MNPLLSDWQLLVLVTITSSGENKRIRKIRKMDRKRYQAKMNVELSRVTLNCPFLEVFLILARTLQYCYNHSIATADITKH